MQKAPGTYSRKGLEALDLVVEVCRRRGIRVVLSLVDNWKYYNGVDQIVDWSSTVEKRTQARPADTNGDPTPLVLPYIACAVIANTSATQGRDVLRSNTQALTTHHVPCLESAQSCEMSPWQAIDRRQETRTHVQMYQNEDIKKYEVRRHSAFFTDTDARRIYKAHAQALVTRVNTYSGCAFGVLW